ncbi:MAG: phosphate ABC transporter ATP-binding protein PstB [Nitriliruptoraceae bacterium]
MATDTVRSSAEVSVEPDHATSSSYDATIRTQVDDRDRDRPQGEVVFDVQGLSAYYGRFRAVRDITMQIRARDITAFIGPSGCGKSTLLRSFNRMNDLIPSARVEGKLEYHGEDLFDRRVSPVEVRRRIGMVFQKPNPFPKSIYDNVAYGPRVNAMTGHMDDIVEQALRRAALWDEVKGRLDASALSLSGGQQQRLCIARAIATEPEVLLMDEPCSALDPIATLAIEDLMRDLREEYAIVIVTHNMQQAARVSDMTAFLTVDTDPDQEEPSGVLVEYGETAQIFTAATDPRTEGYITGRFG